MKKIFAFVIILCITEVSFSQEMQLFPTNWFTGFKNSKLQLIVHQEGVSGKIPMFKLSPAGMKLADGITLKLINRTDNPNYVFLDLVIDKMAKPGVRKIKLGQVSFDYELKPRHAANGKTRVRGINAADFIYLMIPDRFANGDAGNDIVKGYRDETVDRKNKFSRHGGDFKGVQDHLDYFDTLGVTAIWMTPVIENNASLMHEWGNSVAGYHGYWFTDHYQIDKRLGGNEGYLSLCDAAHKKGIKIIQDAVYNHVSKEHWSVLDPPAKDWLNNWPSFTSPNHREETLFDPYSSAYDKKKMLDGWFTDHLPDLNQRNPFVANFLIQHAVWTTETYGIDGWRVDTYKYCDEAFLNNVNNALYAEFPGIMVFGEAWVNSVIGNAYFTRNNLHAPFSHNASGVIDFQSCFALLSAMNQTGGWNDGVNKIYMTLAQDLVYKNPMNNCIFMDNHDMDRVFSVVGEDWDKLKMGYNWLMTMRGIPQLYYGTEILMKNMKKETDAMVREDFPGGWKEDAANKFTNAGRTPAERIAFDHLRALAQFRKRSSAITTGKMTQFVPVNGAYVYFRYDAKQTVMVMANTGDKEFKPDWTMYSERTVGFTRARDVVTGQVRALEDIVLKTKESFVFELMK